MAAVSSLSSIHLTNTCVLDQPVAGNRLPQSTLGLADAVPLVLSLCKLQSCWHLSPFTSVFLLEIKLRLPAESQLAYIVPLWELGKGYFSGQIHWARFSPHLAPFLWSVICLHLWGCSVLQQRGLAVLLPPLQTFFVLWLFFPRAFILPNDLNTQRLFSNQDVNSSGCSSHAIKSPLLFSLSRILLPDFTFHKNPIHFARLNSSINYSVKTPYPLNSYFLLCILVILGVFIYFHISYIV